MPDYSTNLKVLDLPYLLSNIEGHYDCTLYGLISEEVDKPDVGFGNIDLQSQSDCFAVLDLVGVSKDNISSYALGQVLIVVPRTVIQSAKKKPSGKLAVKVWGKGLRKGNKTLGNTFVSMLSWRQTPTRSWTVSAVKVAPLTKQEAPQFFDVVMNAYKQNWTISLPVPVPSGYLYAGEGFNFYPVGSRDADLGVKPQQDNRVDQVPSFMTDWAKPDSVNLPAASIVGKKTPPPPPSNLGLPPETLNGIATPLPTSVSIPLEPLKEKIKGREMFRGKTQQFLEFEKSVSQSDSKVQALISKMLDGGTLVEGDNIDKLILGVIDKLKSSWDRKQGAHTGRALYKLALDQILPHYSVSSTGAASKNSEQLDIQGLKLLDIWGLPFLSDDDDDDDIDDDDSKKYSKYEKTINANRIKIYFALVEAILGIKGSLVESYTICYEENLNLLDILETNPYYVCLFNPSFDMEELDKLAMYYGVDFTDMEVLKYRNIAFIHNYLLDSANEIVGDNTIVKKRDLVQSVRCGFIVSKRVYEVLQAEGYMVSEGRLLSATYFLRDKLDLDKFKLPQRGWGKLDRKFFLESKFKDTEEMISDYLDSGLGVELKFGKVTYLSDIIFAKKEAYIYNRLLELCSQTQVEATDEEIKDIVDKYEKLKSKELGIDSFKLEDRQREAFNLVRQGVFVVTGPAGSGKTTVAEGLVYAQRELSRIQDKDILYCAPTGKAAGRLKEVVKRDTRTINSAFGVGGESLRLRNEKLVYKLRGFKFILFDEMSMPNINLLYEVVVRIDDNTRVGFLGDKDQLPPIGPGKPFANMLWFLPTIALNVSKRSSAKSTISRNNRKIIEEDGVVTDLEQGQDVKILHTLDKQKMVKVAHNICRYHLGKGVVDGFKPVENLGVLEPDDIQVITPINGQVWGINALNASLQDVFNPLKPAQRQIIYQKTADERKIFRIGDRAIHVRRNLKEIPRLREVDKGSKSYYPCGKGISNGDVGKIVNFLKQDQIDFDSVEDKESREELIRMYLNSRGGEKYIIEVQYNDVDTETGDPITFSIFYSGTIAIDTPTTLQLTGFDLDYLDLAYALTVHRLQGSQAKLVIILMQKVGGSNTFLTRNMIYTANSRAEVSEYLLGDILGSQSAVNLARKVEATEVRKSVLDFMFDENEENDISVDEDSETE